MLAIVSDLHFSDGTALGPNVAPAAFTQLIEELYALAERRGAADLDLVFLGDTFDLLRSERWLVDGAGREVPLAERPWGSSAALDADPPPPATLARARAMLGEIVAKNGEALAALRGEGLSPPFEVRRALVIGNHDRLALHDPDLAAAMRRALRAADPEALADDVFTAHSLTSPRYRLVARHGHLWDAWNFERHRDDALPSEYEAADYLPTPIGDPITCELVVRIPHAVRDLLFSHPAFAGTDELDQVVARLSRMEDVRPTSRALAFAYFAAERAGADLAPVQAGALREALEAAVQDAARRFQALDYYGAWRDRHHLVLHPDAAERLAAALDALRLVGLDAIAEVDGVIEKLAACRPAKDALRAGAARESLEAFGAAGPRFVAYGHSHAPLYTGLRAPPDDRYANSGTFRPRELQTDDRRGFARFRLASWLCACDAGEGGPSVELRSSWLGP
jgi:UDP-2,3-diacylglucosamine pyrophosphatase LpxH